MHIHQLINEKFPIRNSDAQKEEFRSWVVEKTAEYGYVAQIEATDKMKKTNNIVIGDPEKAQVLFTAHYDTPRRAIIPNLMMPRSILASVLYAMILVIPLLIVSLWIGEKGAELIGVPELSSLIYLVVYFGTFYFMMLGGPVNPHNANDNTSGCAVLLAMMENMRPEDREKAAFVFFDNEEKGLVGSRGFAKLHPQIKKETPVVNLDCVAHGDQILLIAKKKAQEERIHQLLQDTVPVCSEYTVHFFGKRGSMMNSDHAQFDKGMGICACKKAPVVKFACGRIHTPKDTEADTANIDFLARWMVQMVSKI